MKRIVLLVLALAMALSLAGCGKEMRSVTCDKCGREISVEADSNITDEWIVFCEDCGEPVVEEG